MKSIILVIILVLIVSSNIIYSQNSNNKQAQVAAQTFYKKYLPIFGYPEKSDLRKLRPYLSPNLYSLIGNERRRMILWSAKNPMMKPPVAEDLFLCNHYEPATGFRVGKATLRNRKAIVTTYFDYAENGKVYTTCKTKSSFIQRNGKWLLDNIIFDEDVDLKTLFLRKEYDVLPKYE